MVSTDSWSGVYTVGEVARLAQIPLSTLYEWQRRRIISPSIELEDDDGKAVRGYSYADLTVIRILRALREGDLNFTSAGLALMHLYGRLGPPSQGWADAKVWVRGNRIFAFQPDDWDVTEATTGGQRIETGVFGDYFDELRGLEEGESIVIPVSFREFVHIDPRVMHGEPIIRGTRLPTRLIRKLNQAGQSIAALARTYRMASRRAIEAAIEYEKALDMAAEPQRTAATG